MSPAPLSQTIQYPTNQEDHTMYTTTTTLARPAAILDTDALRRAAPSLEGRRAAVVFTTNLTRLQRKILRLLGMPKAYDG